MYNKEINNMSSSVTIQPCKFINHPTNEESFGYRCYDEYAAVYNNLWEKEDLDLPPTTVLKNVYKDAVGNDDLSLIFDFVIDNELGIFIGNVWLEWEEIGYIFKK